MHEMRLAVKWCAVLALCLSVAVPLSARKKRNALAPKPLDNTTSGFDSSRDPARDLQNALAEAARTNKRVLVEVGGDWSVYCNLMDLAFDKHPQLRQVRDTYYVTVKVHYSKDLPNEEFLSHYPKIPDYPHFFVLDSKGVVLFSQPTHPFEQGKKYNAGKIDAFLKKDSHPPQPFLRVIK